MCVPLRTVEPDFHLSVQQPAVSPWDSNRLHRDKETQDYHQAFNIRSTCDHVNKWANIRVISFPGYSLALADSFLVTVATTSSFTTSSCNAFERLTANVSGKAGFHCRQVRWMTRERSLEEERDKTTNHLHCQWSKQSVSITSGPGFNREMWIIDCLGRVWVSTTLVRWHCTCICVCSLACLLKSTIISNEHVSQRLNVHAKPTKIEARMATYFLSL